MSAQLRLASPPPLPVRCFVHLSLASSCLDEKDMLFDPAIKHLPLPLQEAMRTVWRTLASCWPTNAHRWRCSGKNRRRQVELASASTLAFCPDGVVLNLGQSDTGFCKNFGSQPAVIQTAAHETTWMTWPLRRYGASYQHEACDGQAARRDAEERGRWVQAFADSLSHTRTPRWLEKPDTAHMLGGGRRHASIHGMASS